MVSRSRWLGVLAFASLLSFAAGAQVPGHAGHGGTAGSAISADSMTLAPLPVAVPVARKSLQFAASAAFDAQGRLWVVHVREGQLRLQRSDDAGLSFGPEVVVNAEPEAVAADGENRPKIAFAHDGGVLVAWTRPLGKPYTGEIRFARSSDGVRFSPPITVHQDRAEITHRFESMIVAGDGRVLLAWIDKRDLEKAKAVGQPYRGAAIYTAISRDGGRSFEPERRFADHSCECCRIAAALDADGTPLLMWRHVFAPNERDHAISRVLADGRAESVQQATFDRWQIDGCPHHGPSLAVDERGGRHAVWFNQVGEEGRVFYGHPGRRGSDGANAAGQRTVGSSRAEHADLAIRGARVVIAWREFDGERMRLNAEVSDDYGESFRLVMLASSSGPADQPRVLLRGDKFFVFWRSGPEGMRILPLER